MSDPSDDNLVRITQAWAAGSALGSLVQLCAGLADVELRVWGGYGLTGTRGVILRRTNGRWNAWRAEVVPCTYAVPIPVGDTASAATESLFVRRARLHCGAVLDSSAMGHAVYTADTLRIAGVSARNADRIWRDVVAKGVLTLPPRVPRKWTMLDGFTYVFEVRVGNSYRASAIEAVAPEVEADRQAGAIYEAVQQGVPRVVRWRN